MKIKIKSLLLLFCFSLIFLAFPGISFAATQRFTTVPDSDTQEKINVLINQAWVTLHPELVNGDAVRLMINDINMVMAKDQNNRKRYSLDRLIIYSDADFNHTTDNVSGIPANFTYNNLSSNPNWGGGVNILLWYDVNSLNLHADTIPMTCDGATGCSGGVTINGKQYTEIYLYLPSDDPVLVNRSSSSHYVNGFSGHDFQIGTLAHELGHSLGLGWPEWYNLNFKDNSGTFPNLGSFDFSGLFFEDPMVGADVIKYNKLQNKFADYNSWLINANANHQFTVNQIANGINSMVVKVKVVDPYNNPMVGATVKVYGGVQWGSANNMTTLLQTATTTSDGSATTTNNFSSWYDKGIKANYGVMRGGKFISAIDLEEAYWRQGLNEYVLTIPIRDYYGNNPPILSQVASVPALTNNPQPSYTFRSNQNGTISYGGACSGVNSDTVVAGVNKTVIFNSQADGVYSNCTVRITATSSDYDTLYLGSWVVDTLPPTVTISNLPLSLTTSTNESILVNGTDVEYYKFKLDSNDWSVETASTSPIVLSGLADGHHLLSVIGRDLASNWQASSSATSYDWTVDTVAPIISNITFSSDNLSSTTAKLGDTISLRFTVSKTLSGVPTVIIGSSTASVNSITANQYLATTTITDPQFEGQLTFAISNYRDVLGNQGIAATSTTNGSFVSVYIPVEIVVSSIGGSYSNPIQPPASNNSTTTLIEKVEPKLPSIVTSTVEIKIENNTINKSSEDPTIFVKNLKKEAEVIIEKVEKPINATLSKAKQKQEIKQFSETMVKYTSKLVSGIKKVTTKIKNVISNFILQGTPSLVKTSRETRFETLSSYKQTYNRVPITDKHWQDVIAISLGKKPSETNLKAELSARDEFNYIYKRQPDMATSTDNLAVMMIAYGLQPARHDLKLEAEAIKTFKKIYKHPPVSTKAWNIVRAIAYSGVKMK